MRGTMRERRPAWLSLTLTLPVKRRSTVDSQKSKGTGDGHKSGKAGEDDRVGGCASKNILPHDYGRCQGKVGNYLQVACLLGDSLSARRQFWSLADAKGALYSLSLATKPGPLKEHPPKYIYGYKPASHSKNRSKLRSGTSSTDLGPICSPSAARRPATTRCMCVCWQAGQ